DRMHFVGNVMIDTLCWALPQAVARDAPTRLGVGGRPYAVVTLHRPANVDDPAVLGELLDALTRLAEHVPVLFPVHPRTRKQIQELLRRPLPEGRLRLLEPLGYLDMLGVVAGAGVVVTDSGGLQEETTFLGVPCLTVRPNTERPITCTHGTNRLVLPQRGAILAAAERALARRSPARPLIERWDGHAAERIVRVVCDDECFDPNEGTALPPEPRREAVTSSVCLDPSTGSPPRPYGIDFAFAAIWVSTRGNRRQRGGQNAHDARPQKPNRLAEPHCGRTAGRGVHRLAESPHGT